MFTNRSPLVAVRVASGKQKTLLTHGKQGDENLISILYLLTPG